MPRATVHGGLPGSDPLARGEFSNATLTAVHAAGAPDRNGDVQQGALLWSGEATGYLQRNDRTVLAGGQQTRLQTDVLMVPRTHAAPVIQVAGPDWAATTITVQDRRGDTPAETTFRVEMMEHRAVGTLLDHVRLELDELD